MPNLLLIDLMEMDILFLSSILKLNASEKAKLAASVRQIIEIYNSEVPDTASRKTTTTARQRTQVTAKRYAFDGNATKQH